MTKRVHVTSGIYRIVLKEDQRCYIGSSIRIEERWDAHKWHLRRGDHHSSYLQNAWNKYGEDAFAFEIIEKCEADNLLQREQVWLDSEDPAFNMLPTAGNNTGYTYTPEACAKISAALMGHPVSDETRALWSEQRKGRKLSEEHKAKISVANMGKQRNVGFKHTDETRAKWSAQRKGHAVTPETRAKISAGLKRRAAEEKVAANG